MNTAKLSGILSLIASIALGAWFLDGRYAKAEELQKKVDVEVVKQLQQSIMQDKIDELEYQQYELEQKEEKTDLDQFRWKQIKDRLKWLKDKITVEF